MSCWLGFCAGDIDIPGDKQKPRTVHRLVVRWLAGNSAFDDGVAWEGKDEAPLGLQPSLLLPVPACALLTGPSALGLRGATRAI